MRPPKRSPTSPASGSEPCTGISHSARTWSGPCSSMGWMPAPTRPRRWPPRTSQERHSRCGSTDTPSSSRPSEDSLPPFTPAIRRTAPCPATSCSGSAGPRVTARSRDSERRDPGRHQRQGSPVRRGQPVPARGGRGSHLQPADGRAPHRRTTLRHPYEPLPFLKWRAEPVHSFPGHGRPRPDDRQRQSRPAATSAGHGPHRSPRLPRRNSTYPAMRQCPRGETGSESPIPTTE